MGYKPPYLYLWIELVNHFTIDDNSMKDEKEMWLSYDKNSR